jgi:hypothetical protein
VTRRAASPRWTRTAATLESTAGYRVTRSVCPDSVCPDKNVCPDAPFLYRRTERENMNQTSEHERGEQGAVPHGSAAGCGSRRRGRGCRAAEAPRLVDPRLGWRASTRSRGLGRAPQLPAEVRGRVRATAPPLPAVPSAGKPARLVMPDAGPARGGQLGRTGRVARGRLPSRAGHRRAVRDGLVVAAQKAPDCRVQTESGRCAPGIGDGYGLVWVERSAREIAKWWQQSVSSIFRS